VRTSPKRKPAAKATLKLAVLFPALVATLVATMSLTSCQVQPAQAKGQADLFELQPGLVKAGDGEAKGSLKATLKIIVAKGYKWNAEYPFRLTIKEQSKARLAKERFGAGDLKVASDQYSAELDLGATGSLAADTSLSGTVSFSVCDKSVCKVYRNRKVEWTLTDSATPKQGGGE
jgi:hypothetical protein